MKKIFAVLMALLFARHGLTQAGPKTWIAPFKITTVTGGVFTYRQLKNDKPVVLIYFSPTCGHCQAFTVELLKHKAALANKQIVMIAYEPLDVVTNFYNTYRLSQFPNIKMGTEGYSFIVRQYYQVQHFPFLALYSKNKKLVGIMQDATDPAKLVAPLLQL